MRKLVIRAEKYAGMAIKKITGTKRYRSAMTITAISAAMAFPAYAADLEPEAAGIERPDGMGESGEGERTEEKIVCMFLLACSEWLMKFFLYLSQWCFNRAPRDNSMAGVLGAPLAMSDLYGEHPLRDTRAFQYIKEFFKPSHNVL